MSETHELKLVRRYVRRRNPDYTIAEAIDHTIEYNWGEHEGIAEETRRKVGETVKMLGEVVALLHAHGVITTDEVLDLVPSFSEVKPEENDAKG